MRVLFAAMLLAAVSFAGSAGDLGHITPPAIYPAIQDGPTTDNVAYQQPFVFALLTNGLPFVGASSLMMADDFELTQQVDIASMEIWVIYTSTVPTGMKVQFRSDNASTPGSVLWEQTSSNMTIAATGLTSWGYNLSYNKITLAQPYWYGAAATRYWVALQTVGGAGSQWWLCQNAAFFTMSYYSTNNGSSWSSSQAAFGTAYDQFFVLIKSPTGLTHSTWGEIKTNF
jgi:hypothetical protein